MAGLFGASYLAMFVDVNNKKKLLPFPQCELPIVSNASVVVVSRAG